MQKARLRSAFAPWFLLALLGGSAHGGAPLPPASAVQPPAVKARVLPAKSGVRSTAETVLDASAETVASLLADPRNFVPLFPAHAVDVLSSAPDSQVIAVEMRQPWPVGTVKWVEDVVTRREADGHSFVVERNAHPGYFKHMNASWHVAPDPTAETERCIVTYEVSMELKRWAPEWMLRRGNLNGMLATMSKLRTMVAEQAKSPPSAPAHQ
jgi:ribosome-associated toxin RatA of RatAB toxin-antitoxin module